MNSELLRSLERLERNGMARQRQAVGSSVIWVPLDHWRSPKGLDWLKGSGIRGGV